MDSPEERAHWRDVLGAFDGYMQYHVSVLPGWTDRSCRPTTRGGCRFWRSQRRQGRRSSSSGTGRSWTLWTRGLGGGWRLFSGVSDSRNAEFIDLMIQDPVFADMLEGQGDGHGHGQEHNGDPGNMDGSEASHGAETHHDDEHEHQHSHGHSHNHHNHARPKQPARDLQQDKVRSTLRSFVRDWAAEGAAERQACYNPILAALEEYYPDVASRSDIKVLVPGCGLGRLAMEIAALGFWSQGNEFSTYMLIASHFALNQ